MPEIRDVYATPFHHGELQLWSRWQLASDLHDVGYDAAYVLPNSLKSALVPWLAHIPLRIGYQGEHRFGLLNVTHANPPRSKRPPMVAHYAALAWAPGAKLPDDLGAPRLEVAVHESVRACARFHLDARVPLLAFCPGAEYGPAKRWPAEYFAMLAGMVEQMFPYTQIVVLGTAKDAPLAQIITQRTSNAHDLCGQTSLGEACALIAHASAIVTNDSGLMHVGAALGRPLVALYGSTDPRHTPPLTPQAKVQWLHLDCSPCFKRECPLGHLDCLRKISVEQVFDDLRAMLLAHRETETQADTLHTY
jgi:heptosyltransferase-2